MSILTRSVRLLGDIWVHPANRKHRLRAVLSAMHWQVHKRLRKTPRILDYHGMKFMAWPDAEQASAVIYFSAWPDYWEMRFISDYLRAGDTVLDIGANIGVYSLLCAVLVGPVGKVHAFEPDPTNRARLQKQTELNSPCPQLRIEPYAVTDRSGSVNFTQAGSAATRHIQHAEEAARAQQVTGIALDEWTDWQTPAFIKIDIESAEPLAFQGASQRLRESPPPVILFELAGYSQRYGYTSEQVMAQLTEHGYRFAFYRPEARCLKACARPWEEGLSNVLAVQITRWREVEQRCQHEHD